MQAIAHVSRVMTMEAKPLSLAHEIRLVSISAAVPLTPFHLRWLGHDQPNIEEAREASPRSGQDTTRAAEIALNAFRSIFKAEPKLCG